jgi:hypothetical protein
MTKYELWGYSKSSRKWICHVYPTWDLANKRYLYLVKIGRTVKPPQPAGTGIAWTYRLVASLNS